MVIIVEGIDKSGKTIFAKEFCKRFSFQYYKVQRNIFFSGEYDHFNMHEKDLYTRGEYECVSNLLRGININIVLDRFYPSAWVYSNAFNRNTDFSYLYRIDKLNAESGKFYLVYVDTPIEVIKERFSEEEHISLAFLNILRKEYESYLRIMNNLLEIRIRGDLPMDSIFEQFPEKFIKHLQGF